MIGRRIFVTGASGFVGSAIVRELVRCNFRVSALRHRNELPPGTSEAIDGSLTRVSDWEASLGGVDAVVHAGALLDPIDDRAVADRINHRATGELAASAAKRG